MSDLETFYANKHITPPTLPADNDCRRYCSDCTCWVCQNQTIAGEAHVKSEFDAYNKISPRTVKYLSRHMYLLCPSHIPAYNFKSRVWRKFCFDRVDLFS